MWTPLLAVSVIQWRYTLLKPNGKSINKSYFSNFLNNLKASGLSFNIKSAG